MPRKSSGKPKKEKLSKEQRSQIAKDRWAKIKAAKEQKPIDIPGISPIEGVTFHKFPEEVVAALDAIPPVTITIEEPELSHAPSGRDGNGVPSIVGLGDGTITPNGAFIPDQSDIVLSTSGFSLKFF